MSAFGKCHNRPARSDASFPLGPVDEQIARRCVFQAQEADAHDARAWEQHCTAELADPSPTPPVRVSGWKSQPLAGADDQAVTITADGALHRIGDNDTAEYASLLETQSGKFFARVESVLQNICRDETGQFETEEETAKRVAKDRRLREQGSVICDALERLGVLGYRADAWQLVSFGVHSHEITEIPAFRRICLNPYVAHRLRLPMLNWLQYFAQDKSARELRFWTFTTGKRVPIHRLAARIEWLHRRISELNAQPWMVQNGVRIIFRATEFGTLESEARKDKTADDSEGGGRLEGGRGGSWYHPHAHCVVWLKYGGVPRRIWSEILRKVWAFWHHQWDEGGRIRDMRECVKYVTKPGDMVWLAENNPAELAELQRVLFRKRLVTPMDELAAQRRAADVAGLMPALRWKNDVLRWTLIRDPNRNPVSDGSRDSGLIACDGVKPDCRSAFDDTSVPTPTHLTNSAAERYFKRDRYGVKAADVQVCRVVARCSPNYNAAGVKEPRVVVMGSFFDKRAVLAHPLVRRMVSATAEAYREGVRARAASNAGDAQLRAPAPALRVHTGTPTVGQWDAAGAAWEPEEALDPGFLESLAASAALN